MRLNSNLFIRCITKKMYKSSPTYDVRRTYELHTVIPFYYENIFYEKLKKNDRNVKSNLLTTHVK